MSTALPPSDDDRPTEGESAEATPAAPEKPRRTPRASTGTSAGRTTTSRSTTRKTASTAAGETPAGADGAAPEDGTASKQAAVKATTARKSATSKTAGTSATGAAKKPTTPRTRRTTAKPPAIAPEGEAPGIMDAALGARVPLAGESKAAATTADTSSSPVEPLAETDVVTTKRLPTAEEVYAGTPASAESAGDATGAVTESSTEIVPPEPAEADEPVEPVAATGPDVSGFEGTPDAAVTSATATSATATSAGATAAGTTPDTTAAEATTAEVTPAETTAATERLEPVGSTAPASATAAEPHPATAPGAHPATAQSTHPGTQPGAHGRTVNDLADRLDDSRFFSSLFDFTFTNYVTRKLAGPVYVVGLVLIGLGIVVGFANSLTSAIATHAPIGAFVFLFGVLITLVGAMLAVLLLRVGIEVFCAIIEIAQNTRRRRPPNE